MPSILNRAVREPLCHFILIGVLLFAGNAAFEKYAAGCKDCEIHVTSKELERQVALFIGENQRQPTDDDLIALLYAHIEEEALMREALKLGLGDDDVIIRRRLAQKMRFITEKSVRPEPPSTETLKAWFEDNRTEFGEPEKRAFSHIYFSPQIHGADTAKIIEDTKEKITAENWRNQGDPFLLQNRFAPTPYREITRNFGPSFALALFSLEPNKTGEESGWLGPISSAFGMHLVRLDNVVAAERPEFNLIRTDIREHWITTHQAIENQKSIRRAIDKYKIFLDGEKVEKNIPVKSTGTTDKSDSQRNIPADTRTYPANKIDPGNKTE